MTRVFVFWCHHLDKKTNEFFSRISALASKKRSNKWKIRTFHTTNWKFCFDYLKLLFWFDPFLEARAEILENISLFFWKILRHKKDILKLTDKVKNNSFPEFVLPHGVIYMKQKMYRINEQLNLIYTQKREGNLRSREI